MVCKVRGMGDTLLATPALRALREGFPNAVLALVVSPVGQEVLATHAGFQAVWSYDKSFSGTLRLIARIRAFGPDLAVVLHATPRMGWIARLSGAPWRVVHNHSGKNYFSTFPIPAPKQSKSAIQRDLDAIRALGIEPRDEKPDFPIPPESRVRVRDFLISRGIVDAAGKKTGPWMVLAPGAGKTEKTWNPAAASEFLGLAREKWPALAWVLLDGPGGGELIRGILRRTVSGPPVFSGTLPEVGALLAQCGGMVTADSGPKHLAAAVGARTLTFWTREPEAEWHPYSLRDHALVYSSSDTLAGLSAARVLEAAGRHFFSEGVG